MSRISVNNPVRRRLFAADADEESQLDNLTNITQEELKLDRIEKKMRWNFDFENETPLPGDYEWVRTEATEDYIGRHVRILLDSENRCREKETEDCVTVSTNNKTNLGNDEEISRDGRKAFNETTPDKDSEIGVEAKRCKLNDGTTARKSAKRNIMFE